MPTNLPPADELHAVREQLKALTSRERELRFLMLSDPSARTGNHYVAELKDVTRRELDRKALRDAYPEAVEEHTHPVTVTHVEVWAIDPETGEIVRIIRKSKETTGSKCHE